jgi:hypothetical protein
MVWILYQKWFKSIYTFYMYKKEKDKRSKKVEQMLKTKVDFSIQKDQTSKRLNLG